MQTNHNNPGFSTPKIDVPATSQNLKKLRLERNISVKQIQNLFGMENPQSIYTWENPDKKFLPCIDNLVTLANFYKVTLDEMIIIKRENTSDLSVRETSPYYGVSKETLDFIADTASSDTKVALQNYYNLSI